MRPSRLQISGFTAFREEVTVDFAGADLFALTGPTGSGKSSLIDAMVFALYGSVPRIGQREVAPIVSLGKLEARVLFEFMLEEQQYRIARVVRRTNGGATTAEARLEREGEVLAGTADEVTEAVEGLLGLGFDHFTKSVVLPQGKFAAFLHDRPAERQKLLRELLDLGVYAHMRELANQRKAASEARVQVLTTQLQELVSVTEEAVQGAADRAQSLAVLQEEIDAAEPELVELRQRTKAAREAVERARAGIARLDAVAVPDGIEALADRASGAELAVDEAGRAAEEAAAGLDDAEAARRALPEKSLIEKVIGLHEQVADEQKAHDRVAEGLAGLTSEREEAARVLAAAARAVIEARGAYEAVTRTHAAHALAGTLVEGEECPVCHQEVVALPEDLSLPALAEAEERLRATEVAEQEARAQEATAAQNLVTGEARLADGASRLEKLNKELARAPNLEEALQSRKEIEAAGAEVQIARKTAEKAAASLAAARQAADAVGNEVKAARRVFEEARDGLAVLEPPAPGRDDLATDWQQLLEWASETKTRLADEAAGSERTARELDGELGTREAFLRGRLDQTGLEPGRRPLRDVVVAAVAAADHELTRLRSDLQRKTESEQSIETETERADLAKALSRHLSANGFEAWLMEEALTALVGGANQLLEDLADGAYSLDVVRRDFRVIDHRNADEPRLVKTLSGGETFLVSLALALSLAEQLASMSVHGGGRLESVFLDEGFGTLDIETLDTVAHVIQELGARGRTVGIVTHVRELAEQVPVRFEVRKGAGSATVERVEL